MSKLSHRLSISPPQIYDVIKMCWNYFLIWCKWAKATFMCVLYDFNVEKPLNCLLWNQLVPVVLLSKPNNLPNKRALVSICTVHVHLAMCIHVRH